MVPRIGLGNRKRTLKATRVDGTTAVRSVANSVLNVG